MLYSYNAMNYCRTTHDIAESQDKNEKSDAEVYSSSVSPFT